MSLYKQACCIVLKFTVRYIAYIVMVKQELLFCKFGPLHNKSVNGKVFYNSNSVLRLPVSSITLLWVSSSERCYRHSWLEVITK